MKGGAFTVITNLRMELFEALVDTHVTCHACAGAGVPGRRGPIVGAFSVITNIRMELFEALVD